MLIPLHGACDKVILFTFKQNEDFLSYSNEYSVTALLNKFPTEKWNQST